MTTTLAAAGRQPELVGLSFQRTVDRNLLHRSALSEVFLTDCRPVDEHGYVAAAQLPPLHSYYTDHLHRRPLVDPMLLLECCRQAETYGGHVVFGVSTDTAFILRDWSLRVDGPAVLTRPPGPVGLLFVLGAGQQHHGCVRCRQRPGHPVQRGEHRPRQGVFRVDAVRIGALVVVDVAQRRAAQQLPRVDDASPDQARFAFPCEMSLMLQLSHPTPGGYR